MKNEERTERLPDPRPPPPPGYSYLWSRPEEVPYASVIQRREGFGEHLLQCEMCGQMGVCVVQDRHPFSNKPRSYVGQGPLSGSLHESSDEHGRALVLDRHLRAGEVPVFGFVQAALTRAGVPLVARGLRPRNPTDYNITPIAWAPVENVAELAEATRFKNNRTGDFLRALRALSHAVQTHGTPWWRVVAEGLGEVVDLVEFARCWPAAPTRRYRNGGWPLSVRLWPARGSGWPFWLQRSPFV